MQHVLISTQRDMQGPHKISPLTPSSCPSLNLTRLMEERSIISLDKSTHVSDKCACVLCKFGVYAVCAGVMGGVWFSFFSF